MKRAHVLQILGIAAAASVLVWVATMAVGGYQPGPQQAKAGAEQRVPRTVIDDAMAEVETSLAGPLGTVSSPGVIAEHSPALDRVIALGTPAIPELISQIEDSPRGGIREDLLAICVNRITKSWVAGPPGTDTYWNSGKQFPAVWRVHLARTPETVASIADSDVSSEEKNARLVKLGTPAIPFILDEVEAGHGDLSIAAQTLMEGTVEMGGESPRGPATAEWAKQQKARFTELRGLVLATK